MSKNPKIEECVTMAQFNDMKRSMEEKWEKLSQDLQEIIAQLRIHQNVRDNRNNQDDEAEKTNEQIVTWLAKEQQLQRPWAAAHARRPIFGHRNGGNNRGNGRGRGFGDRGSKHAESDEGDDPEQHWNDGNQCRGHYARNHPNEEWFGNHKFSIPKFDDGSNLEAYLTWELKVDKIFCMHNYSEEKKMATEALEFDDYNIIWVEQLLSDRENVGQGDVRSWAEMKGELRGRFVPKHYYWDHFDKLHNLRQGNLSLEDYYREMEKAMIRANLYEDEEQSIAHFMSGLHRYIRRIVEFQQYRNLIELVH
jgi:hypothetical protein